MNRSIWCQVVEKWPRSLWYFARNARIKRPFSDRWRKDQRFRSEGGLCFENKVLNWGRKEGRSKPPRTAHGNFVAVSYLFWLLAFSIFPILLFLLARSLSFNFDGWQQRDFAYENVLPFSESMHSATTSSSQTNFGVPYKFPPALRSSSGKFHFTPFHFGRRKKKENLNYGMCASILTPFRN